MHRAPRPYQAEALEAWRAAQGRGVVVLPTGAGKTQRRLPGHRRPAAQHAGGRADAGSGAPVVRRPARDVRRAPSASSAAASTTSQPLTVSTYDSAYLHMEHLGARFGLVVFDECHHLPGAAYALAARAARGAVPPRASRRRPSAPTAATPSSTSSSGPIVYRKDIVELSGDYLAAYETVRVAVELSPEDRAAYDAERAHLPRLRRAQRHPHVEPDRAGRSSSSARSRRGGRRAMQAYRRQRELAFAAPAKLDYVALLLDRHRDDRMLLFTQDNATAYAVSRRFLVPVITHETSVRERSEILAGARPSGSYGAVVTSKVLNEGVDIPEANVAVVMSGSASVREHVQRLGRILRARGRQARAALRAGHGGHRRDVHQRAAAGAQCLPLTSSPCAGAATSCASRPVDARGRAARRGARGATRAIARARTSAQPREEVEAGAARRSTSCPRPNAGSRPPSASWCATAAVRGGDRTPPTSPSCARDLFRAAPAAARPARPRTLRSRGRASRPRSPARAASTRGGARARRCSPTAPGAQRLLAVEAPRRRRAGRRVRALAQAQAVLLRARKVVAHGSRRATPAPTGTCFARLKFLRLLPVDSQRRDGGGYRLEIDGPFSLFQAVHALRAAARRSRCRRSRPATLGASKPTCAGAPSAARCASA